MKKKLLIAAASVAVGTLALAGCKEGHGNCAAKGACSAMTQAKCSANKAMSNAKCAAKSGYDAAKCAAKKGVADVKAAGQKGMCAAKAGVDAAKKSYNQ